MFHELDETLQQAFMDYLDERGINEDLGQWLGLQGLDKLSLEYQAWLQRVREFISGNNDDAKGGDSH